MARRAFLPTLPPGPPSAPRHSSPPPSGALGDGRLPSAASTSDISITASVQLLDRLALAGESTFIVQWLESVLIGRPRVDPAFAVRLLRAYRETGRRDRAREFAASLPSAPPWSPLDLARLAIERATI